jgi:hypothetical protein
MYDEMRIWTSFAHRALAKDALQSLSLLRPLLGGLLRFGVDVPFFVR